MSEFPQSLVINISEEDVKQGRRCSAFSCPVARAVKRWTGEDYFCQVVSGTAMIYTTQSPIKVVANYLIKNSDDKHIADYDKGADFTLSSIELKRIS